MVLASVWTLLSPVATAIAGWAEASSGQVLLWCVHMEEQPRHLCPGPRPLLLHVQTRMFLTQLGVECGLQLGPFV